MMAEPPTLDRPAGSAGFGELRAGQLGARIAVTQAEIDAAPAP
jgi:hypothetical protein